MSEYDTQRRQRQRETGREYGKTPRGIQQKSQKRGKHW
jgi:hypothetical protein